MTSRWSAVAITFLTVTFTASGYRDIYLNEDERVMLDNNPLPSSITPFSYELKLYPDIVNGCFNGSLRIHVSVNKSTSTITLHAHKYLTIHENNISVMDVNDIPVTRIIRNETDDTLIINLQETLAVGTLYDVYIEFGGMLRTLNSDYYEENNADGGIFMSNYENTEKNTKSSFIFTKIFPNFARRVFPCFDEPRFKAQFEISVARPSNMTALSMNQMDYSKIQDDDLVWDHFVTIFPISTFSVNIFVSDLDSYELQNISSNAGAIQLQLYYRENRYMRGIVEDTKNLPNILQFLQDYLQVDFPLSKLDVVALPNVYGYSQLYSTGLIVLEEYLVNDKYPEIKTAFANQWVNSLITPPNWKSFNISYILTSFLQELSTENVTCEVNSHQTSVQSKYEKFSSDFNRTEYNEYSIYVKNRGEWFLQMLRQTLGETAIRNALRNLITEHMYEIVTEDDLWNELTQEGWNVQKLPTSLTVADIAHSWLHNKLYRFPVLTVMRNYQDNTADLQQHVFTTDLTRKLTQEEKLHLWWIPVVYLTSENLDPSKMNEVSWLGERELTISNLPNSASFIIVNPTDAGMFLVNYDEENWRLLTQSLLNPDSGIPIAARKKILNDALLLAKGGELNYVTALNITLFLHNEKEYTVWTTLLDNIENLKELYKFSPIEKKMNDYLRKLLQPFMNDFMTEPEFDSDDDYITFWYSAKRIYYNLGFQKRIDEAHKLLDETMPTITINDTDLVLFCPAFMTNTSEDWTSHTEELEQYLDQVYEIRHFLESSFEKCPGYAELISRILKSLLDEEMVFTTDRWSRMTSLITSTQTAENLTFNYFLDNYHELKKKFYFMKDMWSNLVQTVTQNVRTEEGLNKLTEFNEHKEKLGYTKDIIKNSLREVKKAVEWKKKNVPDIELWFDQVLPSYK